MALILSNGSGKGSLESAGLVAGKMLINGPSPAQNVIQDIPASFTAPGTVYGNATINLGKKYSRLQLSNPDESTIKVFNEDGTTVAKSADMNISNAVLLIAVWGNDSIRTTFTFTAK